SLSRLSPRSPGPVAPVALSWHLPPSHWSCVGESITTARHGLTILSTHCSGPSEIKLWDFLYSEWGVITHRVCSFPFSVVPIIRLPGTALPPLRLDSDRRGARQKKRCYRNRFSRHTDILISTSEIKVYNCAFGTPICRLRPVKPTTAQGSAPAVAYVTGR